MALTIGGREGVGILLGRLGDQIERGGAKHGRQCLKFAVSWTGAGRLDRADIRATGADARAEIGLGKAISLARMDTIDHPFTSSLWLVCPSPHEAPHIPPCQGHMESVSVR